MLELTVRLIASLAVVVGLLLLLARLVGKRYGARAGAPVQVVHRQPLSRSASVSVITVGGRVLVLGSTDHQVSLLAELDPDDLDEALLGDELPATDVAEAPAPGPVAVADARRGAHRAAAPAVRRTASEDGTLSGSVLSVQTWRQAVAAATGKAS